jgi:hypothetical protein
MAIMKSTCPSSEKIAGKNDFAIKLISEDTGRGHSLRPDMDGDVKLAA